MDGYYAGFLDIRTRRAGLVLALLQAIDRGTGTIRERREGAENNQRSYRRYRRNRLLQSEQTCHLSLLADVFATLRSHLMVTMMKRHQVFLQEAVLVRP